MNARSDLAKNKESILYVAHVSIFAYWKYFLIAGFIFLSTIIYLGAQFLFDKAFSLTSLVGSFSILIGVEAFILFSPFIEKFTTEVVVTNYSIKLKFGFFRRQEIMLDQLRVRRVQLDQGSLGRAFNFGRLIITYLDDSKYPRIKRLVTPPLEFHQFLEELQDVFAEVV